MTDLPPQDNPDPTKTLVYTVIAGLGFLLASFLGNIVITVCWFLGWVLLAFVAVAFASRWMPTIDGSERAGWPSWVLIVCDRLRDIWARRPLGWRG